MTMPTAPTPTTIATAALQRFHNGQTPEAADVARGVSDGLEKVKRDIMTIGRKWRPLITTIYKALASGTSHYANPDDYDSEFSAALMRGMHTGNLSGVSTSSVVALEAAEDITQANALGRWLLITSGTGVDQAQQIIRYEFSTKLAYMGAAFTTTPAPADGYLIVTNTQDLRWKHPKLYDKFAHPGSPGIPRAYTNIKNATTGYLALYPVPDQVYGLRRRYYADLQRMDTAGTLYITILRRWAGIFEQGVYVWKLGEDDDRFPTELQTYQMMLAALAQADLDEQPNVGAFVTGSTKET